MQYQLLFNIVFEKIIRKIDVNEAYGQKTEIERSFSKMKVNASIKDFRTFKCVPISMVQ